jgi:hypothetical protein
MLGQSQNLGLSRILAPGSHHVMFGYEELRIYLLLQAIVQEAIDKRSTVTGEIITSSETI